MTIDLSDYNYYIRPEFTDMRKGPCSLMGLVSSEMGHDPYDRSGMYSGDRKTYTASKTSFINGTIAEARKKSCNTLIHFNN